MDTLILRSTRLVKSLQPGGGQRHLLGLVNCSVPSVEARLRNGGMVIMLFEFNSLRELHELLEPISSVDSLRSCSSVDGKEIFFVSCWE